MLRKRKAQLSLGVEVDDETAVRLRTPTQNPNKQKWPAMTSASPTAQPARSAIGMFRSTYCANQEGPAGNARSCDWNLLDPAWWSL